MDRVYKIGIPPRGRTFDKTMAKLTELGLVDPELAVDVRKCVGMGKELIRDGRTREEVFRLYEDIQEPVRQHLMLYPNLARTDAPDRIQFREMEIRIDGIPVLLVGMDHEHQPGALINGRIDVAVVGYDETANTFAPYARGSRGMVRKWPAFNPLNKSIGIPVNVVGSMGLGDCTGHFLVSNDPATFQRVHYTKASPFVMDIPAGMALIGDEAYHQLYGLLAQWENNDTQILKHPDEGKDVERHIKDSGGLGFVIVNEGKTVRDRGLFVCRSPVQCSTTVVATKVDTNGRQLEKIITALSPQPYDSIQGLLGLYDWHQTLVGNMGDQWIGREEVPPATLFVDGFDKSKWAGTDLAAQEKLLTILYGSGRYLRATYAGYMHLKTNDLTLVSDTSSLLHAPDYQLLARRASMELDEFELASAKQHEHPPEDELSQLWYWTALAAAAHGLTFDEIKPHKEIVLGYAGNDAQKPEFDFSTRGATLGTVGKVMRYCGSVCRKTSVEPHKGFSMDFEHMCTKEYLRDVVETVYKAA